MTSATYKTLIEGKLPAPFFMDLGVYLQTCAHIEVTACLFICKVEALDFMSQDWKTRFHSLRKLGISELIKALRKTGMALPEHLRPEFEAFINWIHKYKINRHIAAHGAFHATSQTGVLRVIYTHKSKSGDKEEFKDDDSIITRDTIIEAIHDADRILRALTNLIDMIDRGEIKLVSLS